MPPDWTDICPGFYFGNATPADSDVVWDTSADDLTFCHQHVFSTAAHAFFLLFNVFYIGRIDWRRTVSMAPAEEKSKIRRRAEERTVAFAWALRCFVALATVAFYAVSLILQLAWLGDRRIFGILSYAQISL